MKRPFRFLGKFYPKRIWLQIFFFLVFLVVIPLFFLGLLLINTSLKAIKTSVLRDRQQLVIHATGEVKSYIEGPRQALNVTASILGTLKADLWRQETVLVELALKYPVFNRIASVSLNGKELVTSELGTPLLDRSLEPAFLKAVSGESFISPVKISEDHIPVLVLSTPVKSLGIMTGALIAEVNLRGIWDLLDSIKIGNSGVAYLVGQEGRLISHPDKKLVLKNDNPIDPAIIKNVLAGKSGGLEELDRTGERQLVAYAPVDQLNWGLVIAQSAKEAYFFSKVMMWQSWALILLSVLAALVMSIILSRWMSRPIRQLIQATINVARGDFESRLRITRKDEIGRLFRAFNIMMSKVEEAQHKERLSAIGIAATAIAHELKNSLVLINTYIRLLPERYQDRKFIDDFSATVPRELDSWKKMLQNMIDYSKSLKLQKTHVDINALISDVASLAYQRAKQNGVDFVVRKVEGLPQISGNADKLKQVFLNLINNAIEATPRGGSIIMSTDFREVSELWNTPQVVVKIDDSGEGISQEHIERIFDPFFTTKLDGLGLGLAVSQEIIKYHGGRIAASNRPDKGSSFEITIPVIKTLSKQ